MGIKTQIAAFLQLASSSQEGLLFFELRKINPDETENAEINFFIFI